MLVINMAISNLMVARSFVVYVLAVRLLMI